MNRAGVRRAGFLKARGRLAGGVIAVLFGVLVVISER